MRLASNLAAMGRVDCLFANGGFCDKRDEIIKHFSSITPLGRPGYPSDIVGPAAYLASDASRFHTGDILVIDGGRTVKSL